VLQTCYTKGILIEFMRTIEMRQTQNKSEHTKNTEVPSTLSALASMSILPGGFVPRISSHDD
jgi:hypothetical protein